MLIHRLTAAVALVATLGSAAAAEGAIYGVKIESLAVIASTFGGHTAGNIEIKLAGGFVRPAGVACADTLYLTTPKVDDPNRALFKLLLLGMTDLAGARFTLRISDQSKGFSGRCGIVAAQLDGSVY